LKALVSVIVVGHNSIRDLPDCLSSVFSMDYPDFEVIYVDNGSSDGSAGYVRRRFKGVKIVEAGGNMGYGGACNLGAAHGVGEYLLFLNPDVRVDRGALRELMEVMLSDPGIGVCGGKILFWEGDRIQSLGGLYNPETGYAIDLHFGEGGKAVKGYSRPTPVFHCCGACLLVRRRAFDESGGFDGDYFLYFDEVDLCWRIRMMGYEVLVTPYPIAYHRITVGRAHGWRSHLLIERNSLQTTIKNYELGNLLKYLPMQLSIRLLASLLLFTLGRSGYAAAILLGVYRMLRGFRRAYGKRLQIQSRRRVKDESIFKRDVILPLPVLLRHILRVLPDLR
jgi:GT2 family glycosyltransferase